ncbi:SusC/RagA family TonB-linked outer membrane protein [Pararhodonellum marinum]|uniref:SusC/RagA family TonB-linked outer membrane protein n=1 Tax=Pararhodonellum marinum TaxID=2755358 RepID=UPI00188F96E5|nr:TonB-dependent receptor [Pararhodonellum marinum]
MKKSLLFALLFGGIFQVLMAQVQINGKVRDASSGESLPGVNIIVKNTPGKGTITDMDGNFSLETEGNVTLVFSFVGYIAQEIAVGNRNVLNIDLSPDQSQLDEVIVIGYGSVKKSDLTGSVSSVRSEDIKAIPVASFDQALQGRAAGVQVVTTTGAPGGETNIRIRGTSSINASSEPLYVIDGMLINNEGDELSIGGRGPRVGALSTINPNEIESIEILKDASATSIYGSRGANGVILITTKKGKAGRSVVNLESYYGVQEVANQLELLNASQFATLVNDANINAGRAPIYLNPDRFGEGTNWQSELFRTAPISNYQLSISGGNANTRYAISGGYFNQDGIVIGSDFERFSFRVNLDTDVSDRLTIGTNLSYSKLTSNGVLTGPGTIIPGVISNALQFNPIAPVRDPNQPLGYTFEHLLKAGIANPVAEALLYESITNTSRFLGNLSADYKILEGLSFRTSIGIDGLFTKSNTFGPDGLKRTEASLGEAGVSTLQALTWINTNTINYDKKINDRSSFNILGGFELQSFRNETLSAFAFGFPDSRTGWHNLGAADNPQNPLNSELEWSMLSYLTRINYSFSNRYLFTLSGRIDGSSKFAEGNKFGYFPSGAFAWIVSEEPFMQNQSVFTDLKMRVSYGWTGNQAIPPYQSLALVGPFGEGVFNNSNVVVDFRAREPLSYPNRDLKWETTEQSNLGIDMSFLEGRISATTEIYLKNTRDLLLRTPIPFTSGFGTTLLNIGNVQNKGFELAINSVNIDSKLKWNTAFNFSINRNKVTNLASDEDIFLGAGGNILRKGYPIGTFFGYVFDGIFQSADEAANSPVPVGQSPGAGDRKYRDISGPNGVPDGIINDFDRTVIGTAQPDFTWGINNELRYSNFSLTFFFQGSQGNQMVNMNRLNLGNVNGQQNVLAEAGLNRWTPQNPSNEYARALATSTDNFFSSRLIEDASYIRLRNVTLGYNLSPDLLSRLKISNLKIYASATNLLTFTSYSGYDPEANAYGSTTNLVGVDDGIYPQAKMFIMGLNIGF